MYGQSMQVLGQSTNNRTICLFQHPASNAKHDVVEDEVVSEVVDDGQVLHPVHRLGHVVAVDADRVVE